MNTIRQESQSASWYRLLDHVMLLRPTVLMPVWTMTLLGAYQGTNPLRSLIWLHLPGRLPWTLALYSLIMGAVYIVNQLADAETDAINNKLYLLAQGYVTRTAASIEAVVLTIAGYGMAWGLSPDVRLYWWLLLVSGAIGIAYSVNPIRLKGKPFLDLLANAIGYGGIAYMLGWVSVAQPTSKMLRMALPYVLSVGAAFVHSTLLDREGDKQVGDNTTGVVLGIRASCVLSFLLITGAIATSIWSGNRISLVAATLSLPLFGYTVFRHSLQAIALVMRISVALLTLIAALLIPYYLLVLVLIIFGVRWYYRKRFGIRYPF